MNIKQKIPIFITHYTPLKERREFIQNQLDKLNINGEFITDYDREVLSEEEINKFSSRVRTGEKSLFWKQISILKRMVRDEIPVAIIWEDDIKLDDNYYEKLLEYYSQLPEDADALFSSSGWRQCQHVPEKLVMKYPNTNVYLRTNQGVGMTSPLFKEGLCGIGSGSTRTFCECLVKLSFAKSVLKSFEREKTIGLPYDLWLNRVFREHSCKIYWSNPTLCDQDQFQSSLKCKEAD